MRDVAIVGVGMTRFGKHPDKGIKELVRDAVGETLKDAGIGSKAIEAAYVGSAVPGLMTGQEQIKAHVTLSAMGIDAIPMYNVENAFAPSSTALHLGRTAVGAGGPTAYIFRIPLLAERSPRVKIVGQNGWRADWLFSPKITCEPQVRSPFFAHKIITRTI